MTPRLEDTLASIAREHLVATKELIDSMCDRAKARIIAFDAKGRPDDMSEAGYAEYRSTLVHYLEACEIERRKVDYMLMMHDVKIAEMRGNLP